MRPEKVAYIRELREDLADAGFVIVSDYRGLTVGQMETLRQQLGKVKSRVRVVKNTMLGLVAREMEWTGFDKSLSGPTLMVFGKDDVVEAAKVLRTFIDGNNKLPVLKAGTISKKVISAGDVLVLAALPGKKVLQSMVVSALAAPMTGLVGVLQQKLASLVYVLQAVREKKEKELGQ